jgi:MFS family permease
MNNKLSPTRPHLISALCIFAFCMLMIASSRGMGETYGIFLLPLSDNFGWNRANVTSIYAVYMISFGFGSLLSGIAYDRFGPRFNYSFGLLLLSACYGLAGSLSSIVDFYLVIGVCGGLGAAMVGIVPMQSLISKWFTHKRTTALSIAYSGQGIGVMVLAPTSQFMIEKFGWQGAYSFISYGFIVMLVLVLLLPWRRIAKGVHVVSIKNPKPSIKVAGSSTEISLRQAIHRTEFWGFFTILGASAISIFSVSLQLVAYLVEQRISIVQAAFAFGCMGMLTILGITITGILSERYPRHLIASISYGLTLIGILALAALQFYFSWALLVLFIVTFGFSAGARGPIVTAQMAEMFAGRGLASIFGATNVGQGCGAALGAFMAGYLFDLTGGYNTGFVMSLMFAVLGLSMFWFVPAIRHGKRQP